MTMTKEECPNWPFPVVVGGIPCSNPAAVRSLTECRKQTIKRCFGDNREAQLWDFANLRAHYGEALL